MAKKENVRDDDRPKFCDMMSADAVALAGAYCVGLEKVGLHPEETIGAEARLNGRDSKAKTVNKD